MQQLINAATNLLQVPAAALPCAACGFPVPVDHNWGTLGSQSADLGILLVDTRLPSNANERWKTRKTETSPTRSRHRRHYAATRNATPQITARATGLSSTPTADPGTFDVLDSAVLTINIIKSCRHRARPKAGSRVITP